MKFPKAFVWGAASYQNEGGVNEGGRGQSIWDVFSHTPGKVQYGDNGDTAADSWDLPQALQEKGGWQNPEIVPASGAYAEETGRRFLGKLRHWFVMNEPQCFIGVNIYSGSPVRMEDGGPAEVPRTAMGWPVTPESLEWGPRLLSERCGLPIYISENGVSWMRGRTCGVFPRVPDRQLRVGGGIQPALWPGLCGLCLGKAHPERRRPLVWKRDRVQWGDSIRRKNSAWRSEREDAGFL